MNDKAQTTAANDNFEYRCEDCGQLCPRPYRCGACITRAYEEILADQLRRRLW
jgi:hypothetical protein